MKIVLITDSWKPLVNGVVMTLFQVVKKAEENGHQVHVIHPGLFKTVPCPKYNEIRLAWDLWNLQMPDSFDAVHIATEGPVGFAGRRWCENRGIPYTTSYHTKFPEFIRERLPVPVDLTYKVVRNFHKHSKAVLVPTPTVKTELEERNFKNVQIWTRGVDRDVFKFVDRVPSQNPTIVCVSRVSHEKNLEAFCELPYENKILVGDGPQLKELKRKYPDVSFPGYKFGSELAEYYQKADVFVFPSKADTFGIVMLEAMACGTPVAAYPVTGPIDVVEEGVTGFLQQNLEYAIVKCLELNRKDVYEGSMKWTWEECYKQFIDTLVPFKL